jgi:hypothetical protein
VNIDELMKDPVALGVAGGVLLLIIVGGILLSKRGKGPKGRVVDDTKVRARAAIRQALQDFRADVQRAVQTSAPVFQKIAAETEHKDVVGHWRKTMKHRISIRVPNFNSLKGTVKMLGYDSQNLIDLDTAWRKVGKHIDEYNAGVHDSSKVPISFAKEFDKDLQKLVILANMCLGKYAS